MDQDARVVAWSMWEIWQHFLDRCNLELRRFSMALQDFLYELMVDGLPPDWREKLRMFLDEWDAQGFGVAELHRRDLELFVESRATMDGLLPRDPLSLTTPSVIDIEAERSQREMFKSLVSEPLIHYDPLSPTPLPGAEWWKLPEPRAPITSIEERKDLGGWYDEAVATGQHQPGFFERTAVSIVRAFFPDSAPTLVITRSDGTVEITISAPPTSGAHAQQAMAIGGLVGAVATGRVAKEVVETVVDTTVQEATGAPVGPSALKRPDAGKRFPPDDVRSKRKRPARRPSSSGEGSDRKGPEGRQIKDLQRRPVEEANAEHIAKGHHPPYHPRADVLSTIRNVPLEGTIRNDPLV